MVLFCHLGVTITATWILISYQYYTFNQFILSLLFAMPLLFSIYTVCADTLSTNTFLYLIIYFLSIKTDKLKEKLINLSNSGFNSNDILKNTEQLVTEHNAICKQIMIYNKFWSKYLLYLLMTFIPVNLLMLNQMLFKNLNIYLYYYFGFLVIVTWIIIFFLSYCLSTITKKIHTTGKILYKLQFCAERTNLYDSKTKIKLLIAIERMITPNIRVGFSVGPLFVMTYAMLMRV